MTEQQLNKENDFDVAKFGTVGAVNYSAGYGTPASPNVSQDPAGFVKSQTVGANSNTATGAPASKSDTDAQVDQLYKNNDTPSPDEVVTGLKYELQNMIKKDKSKAKELVLKNLRKDPHFYGKLGMLNINDKEMMKTETHKPTPEEQMNERIKLLNQMVESKAKKADTPQSIKDALKETRDKRNARYQR